MNNLKWLRKLRAEDLALWLCMRMSDSHEVTYKEWVKWLNNDCTFWGGSRCPHCGGPLSEIREHNGKQLRHCFSCHFEYYEGGAG